MPTGLVQRGDFGPFMRSLNDKEHGYLVVAYPTDNSSKRLVERFEVRPGDCKSDDCTSDRERSELSESKKCTRSGDKYWYGWSIYLPPCFPNVSPTTRVFLGQFHQSNAEPVWMFEHTEAGLEIDPQDGNGKSLKPPHFGMQDDDFILIPEETLRGQWHRIEVYSEWSNDRNGVFTVCVDGKICFNPPNIPTMTVGKVYFKYGIYRRYVKDKPAGQYCYYRDVSRADTRAALVNDSDMTVPLTPPSFAG